MNKLNINTPIWKTKSVGIADRLLNDDVEINILYKDKNGNRLYPATYTAKKELIKKFPVQYIRGVALHIVPIAKLKIKEKNV
jgi:hypothetical protein